MNGRVWDYNIGRFFEIEPSIKSPLNSQAINPYSYIRNNLYPKDYLDKDGTGTAEANEVANNETPLKEAKANSLNGEQNDKKACVRDRRSGPSLLF